jgi:hypothetical protein
VLVDAEHPDAVEPARIIDQTPPAFGEDGVVGGVPGDTEACGDAGDGEVVEDQRGQRPARGGAGEFRARLRGPARVLLLEPAAGRATEPPNTQQQRRGPVPERLVCQSARDRSAWCRLTAASPAPRVNLGEATLDHRPTGREMLPDGFEAELVQAAERGQVRGRECSVDHRRGLLEMASVGTSIFRETSTPTRPPRRSDRYTLK